MSFQTPITIKDFVVGCASTRDAEINVDAAKGLFNRVSTPTRERVRPSHAISLTGERASVETRNSLLALRSVREDGC